MPNGLGKSRLKEKAEISMTTLPLRKLYVLLFIPGGHRTNILPSHRHTAGTLSGLPRATLDIRKPPAYMFEEQKCVKHKYLRQRACSEYRSCLLYHDAYDQHHCGFIGRKLGERARTSRGHRWRELPPHSKWYTAV